MEIGSILLLLAFFIPVGLYLYAPFMAKARSMNSEQVHLVSTLQAERDRTINALQELDFDHNLGKIPEGEYPGQRALLLQKGAEILRKLDEIAPAYTSAIQAEARIEKAAAAVRADASAASDAADLNDDDLESMIAARRKANKSKSAGFCPKCGKPVLVSDKFCPSCGKSL